MDDNDEAVNVDAMNIAMNDGADLFERIYLGRTLDNIPDIPFRLLVHLSVTEIDRNVCSDATLLTDIVFHDNVLTIGRYAFGGCRNLPRVELPEGLLRLEQGAFRGCTTLREIVIPASVEYIGDYVFMRCTSLQRVVFAPRTTSIELGSRIFWSCSNLQFVTLPQNLLSIPIGFFYDCTVLQHLLIPTTVEQIGASAFYGSGIQAIKILEEEEFIPGTIMLPPKLRSIPNNCFMNCKSLTHIRIPPSVEDIREAAFYGSGLCSITISENVNQIGFRAFKNCSFLQKVTFHSSNDLTLANNTFANCPSLSVILMYQWLWPTLFSSMKGHPDFILKFFRQYQTQIFDFETPTDVMSVRLLRRLRRDRRR